MRRIVITSLALVLLVTSAICRADQTYSLWFPPEWRAKAADAKTITDAISSHAGVQIEPRIAKDYGEIFQSFSGNEAQFVYAGSFAQALIRARKLGQPLVQAITGRENYSGVFVFPKGQDPAQILKDNPAEIAFAAGASSGESSAKAATDGKASFKVPDHNAAAGAVKAGRAKGAFVKNWWWQDNQGRFQELDMYRVADVSEEKNPDNVLTASTAVPAELKEKIVKAAQESKDAFGAKEMAVFDASKLDFSLELMKKGKIDTATYSW
ncbi:MAG TPA: PhnD/SsuA/transferrin family substrate-binding protein [Pseudomonadales bacterium]|nr:PhnD/SsuA/transferrin family substrate-binding protein [Pseudomonadales bacterium]